MLIDSELARGVVKVGDGRGFIVQAKHSRLIITAAHCLPHFPPPVAIAGYDERTYQDLLGPLDDPKPTVWCELIFADPIADIAVLAEPDSQELGDQHDAYEALTEDRPTFKISDPESDGVAGEVMLLSLSGTWQACTVRHVGDDHPFALYTALWIEQANDGIRGGMSGSPIVVDGGAAIGIVCASGGMAGEMHTEGGPNPRLTHHLPGWLLRILT